MPSIISLCVLLEGGLSKVLPVTEEREKKGREMNLRCKLFPVPSCPFDLDPVSGNVTNAAMALLVDLGNC